MLAFAVTVMDAPALMKTSSAGPGTEPFHEVPALKLPPEEVLKITPAKAPGTHSRPPTRAAMINNLEWKTPSQNWDKHRKPLPPTICPPFSNGTSFIVRFGWL